MVKATIEIPEQENRILNIVKGKYGLKNKEEAIILVVERYGENLLEPELRPEFIAEMKKIEKEKGIPFKDIDDLRSQIEG